MKKGVTMGQVLAIKGKEDMADTHACVITIRDTSRSVIEGLLIVLLSDWTVNL